VSTYQLVRKYLKEQNIAF